MYPRCPATAGEGDRTGTVNRGIVVQDDDDRGRLLRSVVCIPPHALIGKPLKIGEQRTACPQGGRQGGDAERRIGGGAVGQPLDPIPQGGALAGDEAATTTSLLGECSEASCTSRARTVPTAASRGPPTPMAPPPASSATTGTPSIEAKGERWRRAAPARGAVVCLPSGMVILVRDGCLPRPRLSSRNPGSSGERDQRSGLRLRTDAAHSTVEGCSVRRRGALFVLGLGRVRDQVLHVGAEERQCLPVRLASRAAALNDVGDHHQRAEGDEQERGQRLGREVDDEAPGSWARREGGSGSAVIGAGREAWASGIPPPRTGDRPAGAGSADRRRLGPATAG